MAVNLDLLQTKRMCIDGFGWWALLKLSGRELMAEILDLPETNCICIDGTGACFLLRQT
jgi:hypothetical protein